MKIKDKSLRLQIFDIPTNKNLLRSLTHKSYFSKLKRLRIDFDWAVLEAKKKAGFPLDFHEPPKKLSVKIVIYKKQRGGRLPDSANYLSELLDSLVRLGVLYDDSDRWFKLLSIGIERGKENMTEIKLEEEDAVKEMPGLWKEQEEENLEPDSEECSDPLHDAVSETGVPGTKCPTCGR